MYRGRILSFLLVATLAAAGVSAQQQLGPAPDNSRRSSETAGVETERELLAEFDSCIQERFATLDTVFGRGRVIELPVHSDFKPKTRKEVSVYSALRARRIDLAMFVVGRDAIGEASPFVVTDTDARTHWRVLRDPIRVTGDYVNGDLPKPDEMISLARATFDRGGQARQIAGWEITTRPVEASEEACVKCHNLRAEGSHEGGGKSRELKQLQVGDRLGVVVYAMKKWETSTTGRPN